MGRDGGCGLHRLSLDASLDGMLGEGRVTGRVTSSRPRSSARDCRRRRLLTRTVTRRAGGVRLIVKHPHEDPGGLRMTVITDTIRNGVDTEQLFATLDLIEAQPELAKFQFRATN